MNMGSKGSNASSRRSQSTNKSDESDKSIIIKKLNIRKQSKRLAQKQNDLEHIRRVIETLSVVI